MLNTLPGAPPLPPYLRCCSGSNEPMDVLSSLHSAPVTAMCYNESADAVISTDEKGQCMGRVGIRIRWLGQLVGRRASLGACCCTDDAC